MESPEHIGDGSGAREPASGPPEGSHETGRGVLVLAGLILDLVDLSTTGPLGIFGLVIGAALVWFFAGVHGFRGARRAWLALCGGVYCALPLTEMIPLGTVLGVYLTLRGVRTEGRRGAGNADPGDAQAGTGDPIRRETGPCR